MPGIKSKYEITKICDTPLFREYSSVQEIWSVKSIDGTGIFELPNKRFSKLYRLSDINFAGVTEEEQKAIILNFARVLKALPCRFSYCVANEYVDEREYNEKILYEYTGDEHDGLRSSFNEVIREKVADAKQGLYQTIYLILTVSAEDMPDAKAAFLSMESAIRTAFIGMGCNGMQGSVMSAVPINERMQLWYNFTHAGLEGTYSFDFDREFFAGHDWVNIISPASICFENESFLMNGIYGKVMYIDQYPKTLESDIVSMLSKVNCTSYVTINSELLDPAGFKQAISEKYCAVGMKIEGEKQRNRNNNDYLADASQKLLNDKEKLDKFLKEMDSLDDHYFNTTILVMFLAETKEELLQIEQKLLNIASLKGFKLKGCFGKQKEGINSAFLFGIQEFKRVVNLSSTCEAMFMPYKTQELNDEGGIFYGVNQLSQNAIYGNKKKLKNRNGIISGQSGSGKSTVAKAEMLSTFIEYTDDYFMTIAPQKEFPKVVEAAKGVEISFDSNGGVFINPMDVDFYGVDYVKLREIIASKSDFIITFAASRLNRTLTAEEQGVIDRVIDRVYSENYAMRKRLNGEGAVQSEFEIPEFMKTGVKAVELTTSLSNEEQIKAYSPTLQDVYQGLLDDESAVAKHLAAALDVSINGSLNLFNHRTNVDLSNRFIVFDISSIKENLRVTCMLVMLEIVREKLKANAALGRWTHLYIDEFHELLAIDQVADFVVKLWKEIRKMNGVLTGITQNMTDLISSDLGGKLSAIVSNSECFTLLSQSTIDKVKLMELFPSVSPAMFSFLDNAESGTGLLKMGPVTVPFDFRMSRSSEIYRIVNTDGGNYGV